MTDSGWRYKKEVRIFKEKITDHPSRTRSTKTLHYEQNELTPEDIDTLRQQESTDFSIKKQ